MTYTITPKGYKRIIHNPCAAVDPIYHVLNWRYTRIREVSSDMLFIEVPDNTRMILEAILYRDITDEEYECISAILTAVEKEESAERDRELLIALGR